jgi:hypothetical protein
VSDQWSAWETEERIAEAVEEAVAQRCAPLVAFAEKMARHAGTTSEKEAAKRALAAHRAQEKAK